MIHLLRSRSLCLFVVLMAAAALLPAQDTGKKKLTPEDARKIKRVGSAGLSPDGRWATYTERGGTSRGPGGAGAATRRGGARTGSRFHLREVDGKQKHEFEGSGVRFSDDSQWAGWTRNPPRPARGSNRSTETEKSKSSEGKNKEPGKAAAGTKTEGKEATPGERPARSGEGGQRRSGRRGRRRGGRGTGEGGGRTGERRRPGGGGQERPSRRSASGRSEAKPAAAAPASKGAQKKKPAATKETAEGGQEQPGTQERPNRGSWRERLQEMRAQRGGRGAGRRGRGTSTPQERGGRRPANRGSGSILVLRNLNDARTVEIKNVSTWRFISEGRQVLYTWTPEKKEDRGLYILDLTGDVTTAKGQAIVKGDASYSSVSFDEEERYLTFWSNLPHPDKKPKVKTPIASSKPEKSAPRPAASKGEEAPAEPVAVKESGKGNGNGKQEKPEKATAKPAAAKGANARKEGKKPAPPKEPTRLWQWDKETGRLSIVYGPESKGYPEDHDVVTSGATFSPDRRRLFVRFRPKPKPGEQKAETPAEEEMQEIELPNGRTIRVPASQARRFNRARSGGGSGPQRENDVEGEKKNDEPRLDVWHWKDAQIATMRNRRGRRGGRGGGRNSSLLHAVDLDSGDIVLLGHERLSPSLNKSKTWGLASDDDPYQAERTWDRSYSDWYVIDARDGSRRRFLKHTARGARFSPDGSTILVFEEETRSWYGIEPATLERTRLDVDPGKKTDSRGVPSAGSFGRMLPGDREMVWSDGKDLWAVPLDGSPSRNMTRHGRRDGITYSHLVFDSKAPYGPDDDTMFLQSVNDRTKAEGVHKLNLRTMRMETLLCMDKDIGRPIKAKSADRYIVTLTSSQHPADLWIADAELGKMRRLTDANPWLKDYAIPESEIVEWRNTDGDLLQGILVKPTNYQPGKRYPTIVYIYELQSNGLHRFRTPGLQLNPQTWAQNGYAVFMPDITYQIGKPGMSSVRCVVPGVQKLIELGITDADRVGLCGHSWGGYETAYIITQTKMFKAAVSGAPVVNMTSAYGGIRWSSGLPRQFQYERTQSRIGGSLWEYPERYIENSPLFHLENVETPTLIMFGNRDGAVPWYQGIEFYLGLRRLGKPCVFLEYKDEDHGLRRRPNQLDYHKRIMAWWDHYLKGVEAPDWIVGPKNVEPLGDTAPAIPVANGN